MPFTITLTKPARADLAAVEDRRTYQAIQERINRLTAEPHKQGKQLRDALKKYRSVRAAGQRYRIIYKVRVEKAEVSVVVIGIRKEGDKADAYRIASKRLG